jgi:hypothetical protein
MTGGGWVPDGIPGGWVPDGTSGWMPGEMPGRGGGNPPEADVPVPGEADVPVSVGQRRRDHGSSAPPEAQTATQRVRVTSPRMGAAARPPTRSVTRDIDEQTVLGEVYMRSLLREQLRLGVSLLGVVALLLGALPLMFALAPGLGRLRILGMPLPWLLLGAAVYPVLLAAAWWYIRLAERNEGDFTDLVGQR